MYGGEMILWLEAQRAHWKRAEPEPKLVELAVPEEEKELLQEELEVVAAVEFEELKMARVAEVRMRVVEVVVLRAVQVPKLLEEEAEEVGAQMELVLRMPAAEEEEGGQLRELGQPKLGPAEEEPEAAWPWTKACEMLGAAAASFQSAAVVPWSSSRLGRQEEVWEVLVLEFQE